MKKLAQRFQRDDFDHLAGGAQILASAGHSGDIAGLEIA
jgi:hypothetical protein